MMFGAEGVAGLEDVNYVDLDNSCQNFQYALDSVLLAGSIATAGGDVGDAGVEVGSGMVDEDQVQEWLHPGGRLGRVYRLGAACLKDPWYRLLRNRDVPRWYWLEMASWEAELKVK